MNKKLVVGITAEGSVNLLRGQLLHFKSLGYDTYLLAPYSERVLNYCKEEQCQHLCINIAREISIWQDIKALIIIISIFKKINPDIVNVGTPKMGLLGMIAAKLLGVKKRIYTCRGFRYEHEKGLKRKVLIIMERVTSLCANEIVCISPSVKELGISDGIFNTNKCQVIFKGSSNGINTDRFNPNVVDESAKLSLLKELGLSNSFIYGFVGRLIDRKGISELFKAFEIVYATDENIRLLIVGPLEFEQISDKDLVHKLQNHPAIVMPGRTDNVPLYLSILDVFVLPAWWEGFGNVLVEAAAMGIPVISTKGTGTRDAVGDGFNGILVDVKSTNQLADAMIEIKNNDEKRLRMGKNGIEWAKNFRNETIWNGLNEIYQNKK